MGCSSYGETFHRTVMVSILLLEKQERFRIAKIPRSPAKYGQEKASCDTPTNMLYMTAGGLYGNWIAHLWYLQRMHFFPRPKPISWGYKSAIIKIISQHKALPGSKFRNMSFENHFGSCFHRFPS